MQPLDLSEFVEQLRLEGCEWADEIAENLHFVETCEHHELVDDIEYYLPDDSLRGKPRKAIVWLGARSELLEVIEDRLDQNGLGGPDADDAVNELLESHRILEELREQMQKRGWLDEGGDIELAAFDPPHNL